MTSSREGVKKPFYKVKIIDEWFLMEEQTLKDNVIDYVKEYDKIIIKQVKMTQDKFNSFQEE